MIQGLYLRELVICSYVHSKGITADCTLSLALNDSATET